MSGKKILIVDDDRDFVDAVSTILEGGGYEVLTASDGEEGLRRAKETRPDLIILDIMMPTREGYSVCRDLKEDPECSRIPILITTAISREPNGESYAGKMAAFHGADDFVEKPLGANDLLVRVEHLLTRRAVTPERKEKRKILIVDDDQDFLDSTRKVLEANGYEVSVAINGDEGLKLAKVLLPDVIILDVMLPDKDGFSVCRDLKKDARTRSIPIIVLTAVGKVFTEPEFAQDIAVDHLADDFADKPIKTEKLLKKIEKHIAPYY
ncbi:hypothetical protein AMJ40_05940 [candidate division TA06 bacterium DG_26]|uniref:Response regulatory domain-containing protein n=1 Tax=candidate division TA06 bacterium DG_26 TaxID=1703771 RepID=A0A0S7WGH1_UNCT6|nr:MAG: hypothetical protein AMJ40_05940 [candidate division TA06 bacterium DG_26]